MHLKPYLEEKLKVRIILLLNKKNYKNRLLLNLRKFKSKK